MTFGEALVLAAQWGATIEVTPRANWGDLHGRFSPSQLRAIAKEIDKRFLAEHDPRRKAVSRDPGLH